MLSAALNQLLPWGTLEADVGNAWTSLGGGWYG